MYARYRCKVSICGTRPIAVVRRPHEVSKQSVRSLVEYEDLWRGCGKRSGDSVKEELMSCGATLTMPLTALLTSFAQSLPACSRK